jgi:MFS family permease
MGSADDLAGIRPRAILAVPDVRVIGVANVFDDVGVYSALQQVIPSRSMGRALGLRRGVLLLSMGLGSAVTPFLIDAWGARGTLIATGLLPVVLAAGQARATKEGKQLREMGAGDSFGEIALLRRIPRTATVTALSRLEVRTLAREEFLAAVTGDPESVEGAEDVVSTRLQAG